MHSRLEIAMRSNVFALDRTRSGERGLYVYNVHARNLAAPADAVGALLDSLASPNDRLWPRESWPRMTLDRPLAVGARGGHGPIGYAVEDYRPGRHVRFRFHAPQGFAGTHALDVEALSS